MAIGTTQRTRGRKVRISAQAIKTAYGRFTPEDLERVIRILKSLREEKLMRG